MSVSTQTKQKKAVQSIQCIPIGEKKKPRQTLALYVRKTEMEAISSSSHIARLFYNKVCLIAKDHIKDTVFFFY